MKFSTKILKPMFAIVVCSSFSHSAFSEELPFNSAGSGDASAFNYTETELLDGANAVGIRPKQQANHFVNLNVRPVKQTYRVNEPMKFKVKGDQNYFLYVFQKNVDTGKFVTLIPNNYTKDNKLRAGVTYTIPGTADFVSDRAGVESMLFVGSTRPISFGNGRFQAMGETFHTSSKNTIQQALFGVDENADLNSAKAITVRPIGGGATPSPEKRSKNKIAEVSVNIY